MERLILVVDDERPIVDILKFNLERENYKVIEALDGETGLELALTRDPDLILLDVMLPGLDGFSVCRKIREKSSVPILMLTAREDEVDKVLGLELGADDYITKPFSVREVMARVKANLRRIAVPEVQEDSEVIHVGELTLYCDRYEVTKRGKQIDLTVREFELLRFLIKQDGKIVTRESLIENVWNYVYYGDDRTVDVTIRRLREKIEDDPGAPEYIKTKRGIGYYINSKKE